MADSERIVIGGQTFMVCASCRYPTEMGKSWSPVYAVPQPGLPNPDPVKHKQALCTECYLAQYVLVYPDSEQPILPDGKRRDLGIVARDHAEQLVVGGDEYALWMQAVERSKASGGVETVPQAHAILSGRAFDIDRGEHIGLSGPSRP